MASVEINGRRVDLAGHDPDTPLLWFLRDVLALNGTRYGCGVGQCGSCTVHLDGEARRACLLPISALDGRKVVTIEGLSGPVGDALKSAWRRHAVPQCGYCQAGQLMTAADVLQRDASTPPAQLATAMEQNLCRCGTYPRIRAAVEDCARRLVAAAKSGGSQ